MTPPIKLRFDKKIYRKAAVAAAAKDLEDCAVFKLSDNGDAIEVDITESRPEMRGKISGEFRNRVIYRNKVKK